MTGISEIPEHLFSMILNQYGAEGINLNDFDYSPTCSLCIVVSMEMSQLQNIQNISIRQRSVFLCIALVSKCCDGDG